MGMENNPIFEAMNKLNATLRQEPWYVGLALYTTLNRQKILVYTNKKPRAVPLPESYMGFLVEELKTGKMRPK